MLYANRVTRNGSGHFLCSIVPLDLISQNKSSKLRISRAWKQDIEVNTSEYGPYATIQVSCPQS